MSDAATTAGLPRSVNRKYHTSFWSRHNCYLLLLLMLVTSLPSFHWFRSSQLYVQFPSLLLKHSSQHFSRGCCMRNKPQGYNSCFCTVRFASCDYAVFQLSKSATEAGIVRVSACSRLLRGVEFAANHFLVLTCHSVHLCANSWLRRTSRLLEVQG